MSIGLCYDCFTGHLFCPCDNPVSFKCSACEKDATGYCVNCVTQAELFHQEMGHSFQELKVPQNNDSNFKLNLVAVICIAYNHYTAFVKCPDGNNGLSMDSPWFFFDSGSPQVFQYSYVNKGLMKVSKRTSNQYLIFNIKRGHTIMNSMSHVTLT